MCAQIFWRSRLADSAATGLRTSFRMAFRGSSTEWKLQAEAIVSDIEQKSEQTGKQQVNEGS